MTSHRHGLFAAALLLAAGVFLSSTAHGHEGAHDADVDAEALAAHFLPGALVTPAAPRACTLTGGTKTRCLSLTVRHVPTGITPGPFCPRQITDDASKGGIWLHNGTVRDVDGAFISRAPETFNDATWQLFDSKTGRVNVTNTEVSCRAAARPDVDPAYRNHCVECETRYLPETTTFTYVIPLRPTRLASPSRRVGRAGAGLTFHGARLDGPAPLDAILGAHTIAPFDDCGGHVNPHVGYHIHVVTDCLQGPSSGDNHAEIVGIALDGYAIHAQVAPGTAVAQDRCGGHAHDGRGYHYHAGAPASNAILGCHTGEQGCQVRDGNTDCQPPFWRRWFSGWFR